MPRTGPSKLRLLPIAACLAAGAALAAELRPLPTPPTLPSQSQTAEERTALERYYQEFTARARLLNPDQRSQLTREFETLRQTAERAGRPGEAAHYQRLKTILVQTTP